MSTGLIITGFIIALIFVLVSIIKFDLHPFISLLLGGIVMGAIAGLPLMDIATGLADGFGSTMASIGILIILGIILGEILNESGSMSQIANLLIGAFGKDNTPAAMNLTGFVVSIPVYFDAAFIILVNLAKSIAYQGKIHFVRLVTALAVGLIVTHAMVIPTPGPTAVAGTMGANIGWFILYGIIAALIGSYVGGVLYGNRLAKQEAFKENFAQDFDDIDDSDFTDDSPKPTGGLSMFLVLLPILLILFGTVGGMFVEEGTTVHTILSFVGDKNIALLISVLVAYFALRKYLENGFSEIVGNATTSAGSILAITGAGGAFGSIITMSGIGDVIVEGLAGFVGGSAGAVGIFLIIIAFAVSALLRIAQGSTTVALITTASIFSPIVAGIPGVSAVLVGLAICAGGAGFSLPNDSGFWVISNFAGFDTTETIAAWTVPASIASVTALVVLVILSFFTATLPGLL